MQTLTFIQTGKWIVSQYSPETREVFFEPGTGLHHPDPDMRRRFLPQILRASAEFAVIAERLKEHPHATTVLEAFGLQMLLDRAFAIGIAERVGAAVPERGSDLDDILRPAWRAWRTLESCLDPIAKLTVPDAVAAETDFDEVLTLELRYEGDRHPKVETVAEVLTNAHRLYGAVARAFDQPNYPALTVIYADSGSSLRFDLRGLGEPIREIKNLLVELWNRYRHRRVDDYRASAEAFLSGLKVVHALESLQAKGAITPEDVARYKLDVLDGGIRLFELGTLPREVPRREVVSNQQLLEEVQRKLLPGQVEAEAPADEATKPSRPERPTRKGTKKTRRRT